MYTRNGVYIQYVPGVLEEAVLEWHQFVFVVLIKNNFDLILEGVAIRNRKGDWPM